MKPRRKPPAAGADHLPRGTRAGARLADGRGITLLELLVAMLIMALIATMLYSVLNIGIKFSQKGEAQARQLGRDRAVLELLHRQIQGAWYDRLQNKVLLATPNRNELKLVTTAPLLHRDQGVVLAIYLYDPAADILYYTEKQDFYNPDYQQDDFEPDPEEMLPLLRAVGKLDLEYKSEQGEVNLSYRGRTYDLPVRCWSQEGGV